MLAELLEEVALTDEKLCIEYKKDGHHHSFRMSDDPTELNLELLLAEWPKLDGVLLEVLRLYPPVIGGCRYTKVDTELAGYKARGLYIDTLCCCE